MRFPPIEPFQTGHLKVSDGSEIYFEASGNPDGPAALYLHGGPGSGVMTGYRRYFDPAKFKIVSLDQRGCGRSRPRATDSIAALKSNTTQSLISDLEELREHLQVARWLVVGMSWGTTLALAYAQAHAARVRGLVLACVCTTSAEEVTWMTEDMRRTFPEAWSKFRSHVNLFTGERLIDAYYRELTAEDPTARQRAADAWCEWEQAHVSLLPSQGSDIRMNDPAYRRLFATLVTHYWKHAAFVAPPGLIGGVDRLATMPCVLIHGRLDISSPLETAWTLHRAWPASELIVIPTEGHGGELMINEMIRAIARLGACDGKPIGVSE